MGLSGDSVHAGAKAIQKGIFVGSSIPGWMDQLSQEEAAQWVWEILLKVGAGCSIAPGQGPSGPVRSSNRTKS